MTESSYSAGRYFEDFAVGTTIRHALGRTVSQTDNTWFSLLTVNNNPIHFDAHYSSQTEFGKPLVNSTFTLAVVMGLTVADISRNGVNLGWNDVTLPAPVFEGDTLYAQTEILTARESESRPHMGLVEVRTVGFNQEGTVVIAFRRTILVFKRGQGPRVPLPSVTKPA